MNKQTLTWEELVALPKFKLPNSSRRWKIEAFNDEGGLGLFAEKVKDEWVMVAQVTKPEPGAPVIAVASLYGRQFDNKIFLKDIIA